MSASVATQAIDPITVEVVRNKLEGIANEMQQTLLRSSFSPIVKEGLDASASLFTLTRRDAGPGLRDPGPSRHADPRRRQTMLEVFPLDTMRPGDVYMHERSLSRRHASARHRGDQPVFFGDRPIALSATMTHHQDVGGMSPGSMPTNATEIFQEGLRIPPLQVARRRRRSTKRWSR